MGSWFDCWMYGKQSDAFLLLPTVLFFCAFAEFLSRRGLIFIPIQFPLNRRIVSLSFHCMKAICRNVHVSHTSKLHTLCTVKTLYFNLIWCFLQNHFSLSNLLFALSFILCAYFCLLLWLWYGTMHIFTTLERETEIFLVLLLHKHKHISLIAQYTSISCVLHKLFKVFHCRAQKVFPEESTKWVEFAA